MAEFNEKSDAAMDTMAREEPISYGNAVALPPLTGDTRRKKKSGAFGIFRAALVMLRKRTDDEKEAKKEKSNRGDWKKIVGSMRPLHVQETPESPMYAMSPASETCSYMSASPAPSTSSGTMSQYASALNLRDLCNSDDEEEERDPDEVFDAITGDEMIDSKAEEFIAQFYKQIEHQNSVSRDRKVIN